jgi:hypothetical protein
MMTDGVAGMAGGENVKVLDIAELLLGRQAQADPRIFRRSEVARLRFVPG